MAHFNKILIARGNKDSKTPIIGELFYDINTKGIYIGTLDEDGYPIWKRFGGFESIILKGTVDSSNWETINSTDTLEAGDAYIVTGSISVIQNEILYNNDGTVTRSDTNNRTYDDFFKKGQVIVFCKHDVSSLPNSCVVETGKSGWVTLAGGTEANDIENDTSLQPVADKNKLYDVQSALDWLFNKKLEYKGIFDTITITPEDIAGFTSSEDLYKFIANSQNMLPGEMLIYNGESKSVEINDETIVIKKNSAIICVGNTVKGDDGSYQVESVVYTIPLGNTDASDIAVSFTGNRKSNDSQGTWTSLTETGEIDSTFQSDDDVKTIQQAIDNLHQTKADLNAQGKIPLSQIPNTFVGALQYIGTLDLTGKTTLTEIQLATLMNELNASDSWEKENEGETAAVAESRLDSGDYVIIKIRETSSGDSEEDPNDPPVLKTQVIITDDEGVEIFRVSEGDHVICNSITREENGTITSVKLDHLDTSSSVDAVNGITAEVGIIGKDRESGLKEISVTTNTSEHTIEVSSPNAVLTGENTLQNKAIPVGNGQKEIVNSEVFINPKTDDSNTSLTGLKSDGSKVTVEFPDSDGKMSVTGEGNGTHNRLPKYDANGNFIDSSLEHIKNGDTPGKFNIVDQYGNIIMSLNYETLESLLQYKLDNGTITRNFDDDEDGVKRTDSTLRAARAENTHTLLDDCSIIDGGNW